MPSLILASSSPYRREILQKLGLKFSCCEPNIDETPMEHEQPAQLVERLALEKALAVADNHSHALIIGCDQVAVLDGHIMTKPHTHDNAVKQLRQASGNTIIFLTGLCLFNTQSQQHQLISEAFNVTFLTLNDQQIEQYLLKEQPYHCAGSIKSESLGITLFKSLQGNDPNTLIGLPLIALTGMLRNEGVEPLK